MKESNGILRFTNDEKEFFCKELEGKYHQSGIDTFVLHLESLCAWACEKSQVLNIAARRDKQKDMLKAFKKTKKYLEKTFEDKVDIAIIRDLDFDDPAPALSEKEIITYKDRRMAIKYAKNALNNIKELEKLIEKYQEKDRQRGDQYRYQSQLAVGVAKAFYECFEKPKKKASGAFSRILYQVWDIVDPYEGPEEEYPGRDLRRTLEAAIKSLKNQPDKLPVPPDFIPR